MVMDRTTHLGRMPGFTGESSLNPASQPYVLRRHGPNDLTGKAIVPQALLGTGGSLPCNPNCVCITQKGCPCCSSILSKKISARRGLR
jgi:hypothetical protein